MDPAADRFGARRLLPHDAVIHRAEGAWLYDVDGHRYLDCLNVASAALQGHSHPRVMRAMAEQAARMTLSTRAVANDHLPPLLERLERLTHHEVVVVRHSSADALAVALEVARQVAASRKGISLSDGHVVACKGNGLGIGGWPAAELARYPRAVVTPQPGYSLVRFGDVDALAHAITPDTVAFVVEPLQATDGFECPPDGYLASVEALCRQHDVLLVIDETQTGLGRTGHLLASGAEGVRGDLVLLGKALSSGFYPVAAVAASGDCGQVLRTVPHDAAFISNPLGCAVACAALDVIVDEDLPARSRALGRELLEMLQAIRSPYVREIRGRGLWVSIQLTCHAHAFNEALMDSGVAVNDAHDTTIRLSPTLTVNRAELGWLVDRVARVLDDRSLKSPA